MVKRVKVVCIKTCKMINETAYDWEDIIEAFKGNIYYMYNNVEQYVYISELMDDVFWELGLFEAINFIPPDELREQIINKLLEND
jgi:hypothetical protein